MIHISAQGVNKTAATRLVFGDMQVANLSNELNSAAEEYTSASEALRLAKEEHHHLTAALNETDAEITRKVTEAYYLDVAKPTQAELDRRIKAALASDEQRVLASNAAYNAKLDMEDKEHAFNAAKIRHRTLTSQASLVSASLSFLGASKVARANALAQLNDL